MRNKLILAAAALAVGTVIATPAAADQSRYGYQQPAYGYGYGAQGDVRQLQQRIAEIRRDIRHFDQRRMITNLEARKLDRTAQGLEARLYRMGRYGIDGREIAKARYGMQNLERMVATDLRDRGNGPDDRARRYRGWNGNQYGYNANRNYRR